MGVKVQLLIGFKRGIKDKLISSLHQSAGTFLLKDFKEINVHLIKLEKAFLANALDVYKKSDMIDFIETNTKYTLNLPSSSFDANVPDDPYLVEQWGLTKVRAPQAWEKSVTDGSAIRLAILDTGINTSHPDLQEKITLSANFSDAPTSEDVFGHGTHVAGIAAAVTNNNLGIAGMSYNSASILNIKVLNDSGNAYLDWIAEGIFYAVNQKANVLNLSLGGQNTSDSLNRAVQFAVDSGVVVVAAAGNEGSSGNPIIYPAALPGTISVAALNKNDALASFSSFGSWVDLAAPGVDILSTTVDASYGFKSGTSMATPFVSGLAALLFATYPALNGAEVSALIKESCDTITGSGEYFTFGRMNAEKAIVLAGDKFATGINVKPASGRKNNHINKETALASKRKNNYKDMYHEVFNRWKNDSIELSQQTPINIQKTASSTTASIISPQKYSSSAFDKNTQPYDPWL